MPRPVKCYGNKKSSKKATEAWQSEQEDQLAESYQWGRKKGKDRSQTSARIGEGYVGPP